MRIALSGASGFIGSALVKLALERGDEVIAFVRNNSPRADKIAKSGVKAVELDLENFGTFEPHPSLKADVFFHLGWEKTSAAARDDAESQNRNIEHTLGAVRLAKKLGCRAFVGAGSQAEFGVCDKPLTPETPCTPESAYGIAKHEACEHSLIEAEKLGIKWNWARILSVYGPNDAPSTLISYLLSTLLRGETPQLTKCEQVWDYLYVDDCARALYAIAVSGVHKKVYPVGSGKPRLLKEFVEAARDAVGPNLQVNFGAKEYYPHQAMYLVADITDLSRDTGFLPSVSFEDGIRRTVDALTEKTTL